jgi:hypothetical protein
MRKIMYLAFAALTLAVAVASPASADKLTTTSSSGALVASGTGVTLTSSNVTWVGTWFGVVQTITCSGSTWGGVTASSNVAGSPVRIDITSVSFSGCVRGGTACTVTSNASSANKAPIVLDAAVGATSGSATMSFTNVTVTFSGCILGGSSCTWIGGGAAPANDLPATFTSPLGLQFTNGAMKTTTAGCPAQQFSGTYAVVTSGGAPLYVTGT